MSYDLGYEIKRTVLIELQEEKNFVELELKTGKIIYGYPDIIVYVDEDIDDPENFNETEYIRFLPDDKLPAVLFLEEEIKSFTPCKQRNKT